MSATRAIVFDTNVFGRSKDVDFSLIQTWASACRRNGAELWIPEVVLWELVEHTLEKESAHLTDLRGYNKARQRWGIEPLDTPTPLDLIAITALIRKTGARIVPLLGNTAHTALKDQILQTGPGSKKSESKVKTGAADSAWLRSVFDYNDESFEDLIVVSGDKQAIAAIEEDLEQEIFSVPSVRQISDLLGPPAAAPAQLPAFRSAVEASLSNNDFIDTEWDWAFEHITGLAYDALPDANELAWQLQQSSYTVGDTDSIEELVRAPWTQALTATVRLTVIATDFYARQNFWGDTPEYATVTSEAFLTIDVMALPNDDGGGDGLEIVDITVRNKVDLQDTSVVLDS